MNLSVLIVTPPNYPHSEAFRELAETIHFGLLALGHSSRIVTQVEQICGKAVVLGSNLLSEFQIALPEDAILYNLEQISATSPWLTGSLIELFRRHQVWDYHPRNIEILERLGVSGVRHVPVGYVPELTRIPTEAEDTDVLFYGSVNPRRAKILDALAEEGLKIERLFGVYGARRDQAIARARIVLNLHYYDAKLFEIVRISYLLSNRKFVISERGADPAEEHEYTTGILFADYEQLVERTLEALADPIRRRNTAERGFETFSKRSMADALANALEGA